MPAKRVPPEMNELAALQEIAARWWPTTLWKDQDHLRRLRLAAWRPIRTIAHACKRCGSVDWHVASPRNMKLQCGTCRDLYFPRAGSLARLAEVLDQTTHRAYFGDSTPCEAKCFYQRSGVCGLTRITIDQSARCGQYRPVAADVATVNGGNL